MQQNSTPVERVVSLDTHPDTFTSVIAVGPTPRAALIQRTFDKVPLTQLKRWALKYTTPDDILVLEASGNSFHVARTLQALGRKVKVLESAYMGKLKDTHANNDRISAVRIAKAFMAGTAKEVWIPDLQTQQRRDWHHAHRKAVRNQTRLNNSLLSYLSDNGVRTDTNSRLLDKPKDEVLQWIRSAKDWSPTQWQVIEIQLSSIEHTLDTKRRWESLLAQEVARDPLLLSLVRLTGVREVVAFALGAVIGDIRRFAKPKNLVAYVGFNPGMDDSGNNSRTVGIRGRGQRVLRSLLIESAHSLMRSNHPLGAWGRRLLARKGEPKLVVAAVARKLLVSVWYLMMGQFEPVQEIPKALDMKLSKIISHIGAERLAQLQLTRKALREQMHETLKTGRVYVLNPNRKYPSGAPQRPSKDRIEAELDAPIPG